MRWIALRKLAFASVCSAMALAAFEAGAAPPPAPPPKGKQGSNGQFSLRREEAGGAEGVAARNKARAGDCEGALPLFDAALRTAIEPTLNRDRGLCHEKLGHPYPAIDDYRAYLTARPDGNDADQIRERLARLEEQTGQGGPSSRAVKDKEESAGASAAAEASVGEGKAEASASIGGSASTAGGGKRRRDEPTASGRSYDEYVAQEKTADAAESSALRYGEGFVLGPYLHIPRYFFVSGSTSDMAYSVGARAGYSTSSSLMLVAEVGYAAIGTSGRNTSAGGPLFMLGAELRIPISRYASDQILLGAGLGFERYVVSGTRVGVDYFPARLKLGYRHVFGPALALDIGADGGPAYGKPDDVDGEIVGIVGGSAAFLIAF